MPVHAITNHPEVVTPVRLRLIVGPRVLDAPASLTGKAVMEMHEQ